MWPARTSLLLLGLLGGCHLIVGLDGLYIDEGGSGGAGAAGSGGAGAAGGGQGCVPEQCKTEGGICDLDGKHCVAALCGSADVQPSPQSCQGGGPGAGKSCGPNNNADCCKSRLVPCGAYYRSNDKSYPASVSDFRLDVYEITVGRFRAFVSAGQGTQQNPPAQDAGKHPKIPGSGWDPAWKASLEADTAVLKTALQGCSYPTWTDNAGANERLPINCITWFEAFAFCAWDGGRLPTEAEWNYAAAGGDEQRVYPWGAQSPDSSYAVYECNGDGQGDCSFADILAVGSRSPKGNGRWGQADLGGSMWEWVLDWYANDGKYPMPCNDCANLMAASPRVGRGGCWYIDASYLLSAYRNNDVPSVRGFNLGSRCARTP